MLSCAVKGSYRSVNLTVSQDMEFQHMDSSYLVVFSVVGSVLLLFSVLIAVVGFSRLSALHARQKELLSILNTQAMPKQLEKAVVVAEGSRDRVDTALMELGKFREGVHSEMQRFYAIMRRNEKAAAVVELPRGAPNGDSEMPDEIPVSSLKDAEQEEPQITKAELRKQARAAGL